ncbi:MAG: hypothetical protein ABIW46_09240, partial [Acidimicrobiales bacterium]
MLRNAWLIPALPVASFVIILFFGRRLPHKGHEVGLAAVGLAFVLSLVAAAQWIDRPATLVVESGSAAEAGAEGGAGHGGEATLTAAPAPHEGEGEAEPEHGGETGTAEEAEHEVEPIREAVEREFTWYENGAVTIKAGTHMDGLAVVLAVVVSLISLLVHV